MKKRLSNKVFPFIIATVTVLSVNTKSNSVEVDTFPDRTVFVGGNTVGVQIDIDGIMVVGLSAVHGAENGNVSPAKEAGIKCGDIITHINSHQVKKITELCTILQDSNGKVNVTVLRNGERLEFSLLPEIAKEDGMKKVGAWVRDGTAGVGTLTFIDSESGIYGALGHAISDADTGDNISVGEGSLTESSVVGIRKGTKGVPGELQGVFSPDEVMASVLLNTEHGIFGKMESVSQNLQEVKVASRDEVEKGKAHIVTNIEGEKTETYEIEITRIDRNSSDNKGLVIKVTDKNLLNKTGGIVQGMSGSPILQNGKIIGAVTHVFLNDPKRGYGTFIDLMINNIKKLE